MPADILYGDNNNIDMVVEPFSMVPGIDATIMNAEDECRRSALKPVLVGLILFVLGVLL